MNEGYLALLISIFREVTPDKAFMALDGKNPKAKINRHKWTAEEFEEIGRYREEGLKWKKIGELFGMRGKSIQTTYQRYVAKRGNK